MTDTYIEALERIADELSELRSSLTVATLLTCIFIVSIAYGLYLYVREREKK